jgi:hypothetical protein
MRKLVSAFALRLILTVFTASLSGAAGCHVHSHGPSARSGHARGHHKAKKNPGKKKGHHKSKKPQQKKAQSAKKPEKGRSGQGSKSARR